MASAKPDRSTGAALPPAPWGPTLRAALAAWAPWRARLAVIVALSLVTALGDLALPWLTGRLVDALADGKAGDGGGGAARILALWLATAASVQALRALFVWLWHGPTVAMLAAATADATAVLLRQEVAWHLERSPGAPLEDLQRGVRAIETISRQMLFFLLPALVLLCGVMVLVATISALAAGLAVLVSLIYLALAALLARRVVGPRHGAAAAAETTLSGALTDLLAGHGIIASFAAAGRELVRLETALGPWRHAQRRARAAGELAGLGQALFLIALLGALLGGGLIAHGAGQASAGDLAFLLSAGFMVKFQIAGLGSQITQLEEAVRDRAALAALLERVPRVVPPATPAAIPDGPQPITLDRVRFAYPGGEAGAPVLDGLSVCFAPGRITALAGPSGAGKTTIVRLLARLYDVEAGAISVGGVDLRALDPEAWRRQLALVPQDPVMFNRTLAENLALAAPDADDARMLAALAQAGLGHLVAQLPQGLDTLLGDRGQRLSGGERQRLAIARALLAGPRWLILDEPTAALDEANAALLHAVLRRLVPQVTIILISHRPATLAIADHVIRLEQGAAPLLRAGRETLAGASTRV